MANVENNCDENYCSIGNKHRECVTLHIGVCPPSESCLPSDDDILSLRCRLPLIHHPLLHLNSANLLLDFLSLM